MLMAVSTEWEISTLSNRTSYQIGAGAAIAGVALMVTASSTLLVAIQDPFGMVSAEVYMAGIAGDRTLWLILHLAVAVGMLLKLAGMLTIGATMEQTGPDPLARIGNGLAVVGVALLLVTMARDGYVHAFITDSWQQAGSQPADIWSANFAASLRASYAAEIMSLLAFVGFAPLAYGAAMLSGSRFPRWIGLLGVIGGLGGLLTAAVLWQTGNTDLGYGVLYPLFVILLPAVWLVAAALNVWRQGPGLTSPDPSVPAAVTVDAVDLVPASRQRTNLEDGHV